jgi:hypothetical protein
MATAARLQIYGVKSHVFGMLSPFQLMLLANGLSVYFRLKHQPSVENTLDDDASDDESESKYWE